MTPQEKKRSMKQDPYRWAQRAQRVAAHQVIKDRLKEERAVAQGDPVRGLTTPFIESFDSAGQAPFSSPPLDEEGNPLEEAHALPTSPHILNNFVRPKELDAVIEEGRLNTGRGSAVFSAELTKKDVEATVLEHRRSHSVAAEAMHRIFNLNNGGAKDRQHANIRRIVETFGRHNTDSTLKQKGLSAGVVAEPKPVRGGPDTGSSEVQIAIMTAKIRALANELDKTKNQNGNTKDKANRRGLRELVHKRQRMLKYMERKERGSGRWHHMIETLGLSPATWKEQISI